jgi:hypothetical protein
MDICYDPPRDLQDAAPAIEIMTVLADLPPQALINKPTLAKLFKRHPSSIDRAVQRGELPPSVALLNEQVWTVGCILDHLNARLEAARKTAVETTRRLQSLRPGQGGLS